MIGIVVAVALAAGGTLLLVGYVNAAEDRALAGEEVVPVLVVDQPIEKGADVEAFASALRTERVPAKIVADGAVTDLTDLDGLVAGVDLLPGEQLSIARFTTPETLAVTRRIPAPDGFLEVTVSLAPDRAVGGRVVPGDTVAVLASFDPLQVGDPEPGTEDDGDDVVITEEDLFVGTTITDENGNTRAPNATGLLLRGALVTNVQVEQLPRIPEDGVPEDAPELAPTGNLLITVAVLPADAPRLVFTAEHGFIWLAGDPSGTPGTEADYEIQTRETVYR
jgi:pilus assembly protein CpaB